MALSNYQGLVNPARQTVRLRHNSATFRHNESVPVLFHVAPVTILIWAIIAVSAGGLMLPAALYGSGRNGAVICGVGLVAAGGSALLWLSLVSAHVEYAFVIACLPFVAALSAIAELCRRLSKPPPFTPTSKTCTHPSVAPHSRRPHTLRVTTDLGGAMFTDILIPVRAVHDICGGSLVLVKQGTRGEITGMSGDAYTATFWPVRTR